MSSEFNEKEKAAIKKYESFLISDFESIEVCDAFLDDFDIKISQQWGRVENGDWGLGWRHGGIGMLAPSCWDELHAKIAGCVFIYLWLRNITMPDCQTLGYAYAYMIGGKNFKSPD